VHLVGFTVEIYYNARSYKRQNRPVYIYLLGAQLASSEVAIGSSFPGHRAARAWSDHLHSYRLG